MLSNDFTRLLGIQHPVVLAGMGNVGNAPLVAAVSNAGGLGVVGGTLYTPQELRETIREVKSLLDRPDLPFGVDLLLPQVGGNARKTNYDILGGKLNELVDEIIAGGVKLFVCAVGVPPKHIVDRLHKAGVFYMNVVGHPKHVHKACSVGADMICSQGGEAGGQTGDIPFSVLTPACADICRQYTSPLTGKPVMLVAGGGVFDGRSLAAALMFGASAVWVGTRFVTAKESDAPQTSKDSIVQAGFNSTIRTVVFSGRPLRALTSPYLEHWESHRQDEIRDLTSKGIIPLEHELKELERNGKLTKEIREQSEKVPMGAVSAMVTKVNQPAGEIVKEITDEAEILLKSARGLVEPTARI